MGGLAFALLYSTLGIPIAWVADRSSRRRIMAGALAIWSGFTALCALTTGFWSLFGARVGVGVGEAGGVAPAYSLISDYFPKEQRARALGLYSLGIPVGGACGVLFGGLIAQAISWRAAFAIVGSAGVLVAPLLLRTVRDPHRGGYDTNGQAGHAGRASAVRRGVRDPRAQVDVLAARVRRGRVVGVWLRRRVLAAVVLHAQHADDARTGRPWYYSAITVFGGCLGIFGGGWIADRVGREEPRGLSADPGDRVHDRAAVLRRRGQHDVACTRRSRSSSSRPASTSRGSARSSPRCSTSYRRTCAPPRPRAS